MNTLLATIREHRALAVIAGVVGVVLIGWLGYLFQPWQLFIDTTVDEDFPVSIDVAADDASRAEAVPSEEMPSDDDSESDEMPTAKMPDEDGEMPDPPEAMVEEPALLASGTFMDRSHPTTGTIGIYELMDGTRVLRLEDLDTDNGPDLYLYLSAASADAPAGEFDDQFANLGRLKGNLGNQNYEIPPDVDLADFTSVVIWCDRFDVAFGSATLTLA